MDPSESSITLQIVVIIILTLINAFFASAEIAFVSINQSKINRMADEGDKRAKRVLTLIENSDQFLATIQVAITLAGFLSSASAATSFGVMLARLMPSVPGVETVATLIVTVILSYFTLVFGELFPKQIALQMPESVALATSGVVSVVQTLTKPFVWLLSASTQLLQNITPIDFTKEEEKFTRDEMQAALMEIRKTGSMDAEEVTMMEGVLSLDEKIAREVMVPRTDTQMLDIEDSLAENMAEILDSPFSRIPLYQDDKDNVVGIIHVKHLFKEAAEIGFENVDLLKIASEPMFVPGTIYIDDLLIEFRHKQTHMAILIDEYGGVEGIVTMEDLLEEIVGRIEDETDIMTRHEIHQISEGNYYLNGTLSIDEFNDFFEQKIEAEDVDTIAGLIIQEIGYVPQDNEHISIRVNDFVLITDHIENGRIYQILLKIDAERELPTDATIVDEETADQLS